MLNLYSTYAVIIGELNTERFALNILDRWKTQDIGSELRLNLEYSEQAFAGDKNDWGLRLQAGEFYEELPNEMILMKLRWRISECKNWKS